MPETTSLRSHDYAAKGVLEPVDERVRATRTGLDSLLREAAEARRRRAEVTTPDGAGAVCAWNHFENIPTFYNWNNRPR